MQKPHVVVLVMEHDSQIITTSFLVRVVASLLLVVRPLVPSSDAGSP